MRLKLTVCRHEKTQMCCVTAISWKFYHMLVVADIDGKRIRIVVRKTYWKKKNEHVER